MAQYTPKSTGHFDLYWQPALTLAAKILGDAQNRWLVSDAAFPTESVTSIILRIFAFNFCFDPYEGVTQRELCGRTFNDWLKVIGAPIDECVRLLPKHDSKDHMFVVESISAILDDAVRQWENDACSITTDAVIRQCAKMLASNRCIKLYA